ncbi:maleylacetoacetate isomerase (plasmid) [Rhizobium sp. WSM1274]|uniref:maleylacetoacetate isomerase n=1 Tax=Rhizobium sp. WSM1274 TaxID=3138254 RepID=UPI0021A947B2|nr:maleylacetoacetate isomerase [Rhizobium leguminosarum]UWU30871.1 maleylacetoacetate isomerase [Rhizobium leguminosarum bv. viciae]
MILFDYWRSSASYRVRIGLNLLGLRYESRPVDLLSGLQRSEENLARNPQGLVPTLAIDGVEITQSLAILEYLNETRSAGWLPVDVTGRAKVRALSYAIAMEIHPICNLRVARYAVSLGGTTIDNWMKHFIEEGVADFEAMLASGSGSWYCHGSSVSLADICLVPQIYNARRWGVDMNRFPTTAAIASRLEVIPAFAAAHPDMARAQP